jgi:isopropylmalate/homocitrate/citramalate synthase
VDVGIHYDKLYGTAKLVRELAGAAANRPIVGENTFDVETGEGVLFLNKVYSRFPTIICPVLPQFVGHPEPKVVMGKKSGADTVLIWADKLGLKVTKEEAKTVVGEVKERAFAVRRPLTEDEFLEIMRKRGIQP